MHSTTLHKVNIDDNVQSIIIRILCIGWIIARLKSYKVWFIENRLYPSIPAFDFLDGFPPFILGVLYYVTIVCLIILLVKPRNTTVQIILFFSVLIAAILELNAWQPWEYQYLSMIAVFILNKKKPIALYTAIILIMATIYFYSGMQKLNGGFLHSVWKGLILKRFFAIYDVNIVIHYVGLVLPIIEAIAGLGLLFKKFKKTAAYVLISMHFFILVLLGTVQGFNIVLPWNIVMIVILHYIFILNNIDFAPSKLFSKQNIFIFILWAIMPVISFLGYWEQKLSSNLFSGRYINLAICTKNVPNNLRKFILEDDRYRVCADSERISVSKWAMSELAILPPTSDWYYKKFIYKFKGKYTNGDNSSFYIYTYPYKRFRKLSE